MLQVKQTRGGSSIGVRVAYGVNDSLVKANEIMSEVFFNIFVTWMGPKTFIMWQLSFKMQTQLLLYIIWIYGKIKENDYGEN